MTYCLTNLNGSQVIDIRSQWGGLAVKIGPEWARLQNCRPGENPVTLSGEDHRIVMGWRYRAASGLIRRPSPAWLDSSPVSNSQQQSPGKPQQDHALMAEMMMKKKQRVVIAKLSTRSLREEETCAAGGSRSPAPFPPVILWSATFSSLTAALCLNWRKLT
jgi:hypothetical protein